MSSLHTVTDILTDIRLGKMVILVDDEDRENEGDLVMSAEHISASAVNFMATHGRGLICLSLTEGHCQQLGLSMMVSDNRSPYQTAFTVSIEAAQGVTTGISAHDRAHTIRVASREHARPTDIVQPGHIFPLKARSGGVLTRAGHTEASVDLARLAGLHPSAVICEILNEDGTMARLPDLQAFAKKHQLKIGSIADLIEYRMTTECLVERMGHYPVHLPQGNFEMHLFRERQGDVSHSGEALIHIALTKEALGEDACFTSQQDEIMVRVQYPLTVLDFMPSSTVKEKLSTYPWQKCLERLAQCPAGVAIGLRAPMDEQNKFQNIANNLLSCETPGDLPTPRWDSRIYGTGAQMLRLLGVKKMRLLSHPVNLVNIKGFGLEIMGFEKVD